MFLFSLKNFIACKFEEIFPEEKKKRKINFNIAPIKSIISIYSLMDMLTMCL